MDYIEKDVAEVIKESCRLLARNHKEYTNLMVMLTELVDRRTPHLPLKITTLPFCPQCHRKIPLYNQFDKPLGCRCCGQAFTWDGYDQVEDWEDDAE